MGWGWTYLLLRGSPHELTHDWRMKSDMRHFNLSDFLFVNTLHWFLYYYIYIPVYLNTLMLIKVAIQVAIHLMIILLSSFTLFGKIWLFWIDVFLSCILDVMYKWIITSSSGCGYTWQWVRLTKQCGYFFKKLVILQMITLKSDIIQKKNWNFYKGDSFIIF